jgi:hypothetical protein
VKIFDDTPDYRMMPADLEAWLRANPNCTEEERRAAFKKFTDEAAQRVLDWFAAWSAASRAGKPFPH